jgi:predicted DNA-binding protein
MPRPRKPHTRLEIRMSQELYQWLKAYANRTGRSMAAIIKEPLESLKRKDERTQQKKNQ